MQVISSEKNPAVQYCLKLLRGRVPPEERKLFLEGPHLVEECAGAGVFIQTFFYAPGVLPGDLLQRLLRSMPLQTRKIAITASLLRKITLTETPQGVVAVAAYPEPDPEPLIARPDLFALIADRIQDPGNLGAMIRTAAAAGMHAVFCTPGTVDFLNPKVVRSTAGAIFHTDVLAVKDPLQLLEKLKNRQVQLTGADPGAGLSYEEACYGKAAAIIIGNESSGISPELLKETDLRVKIPLKDGIDSLNASTAAAIIIYEARRKRSQLRSNGSYGSPGSR